MKKQSKKIVGIGLCIIIALSAVLTGCQGKSGKSQQTLTDFTFPLEEPVTFTFMVEGSRSSTFDKELEENKLWQKLKEETNVNIEFQFLGDNGSEKLAMLINSGDYGDVLMGGPILNSISASQYLAADVFVPITDYVNDKYMPNLTAMLKADPLMEKNITSAEGEIVTVPRLIGVDGAFLESPLWINKAWLDKLGLSVPTTIDEFTNVLRAFATKDPNGNGVADEIPYFISNALEYYSFDAFLGCWGLATKSGENDSYVQVVNGETVFVPTTEAYKEALGYLAQLYQEQLIYQEAFTASSVNATAKLTSSTCVVGCFTSNSVPTTDYSDDYVAIMPPKVEGYETKWFYHYGVNGNKNFFYVTDSCENVAVLMAWIDKLYELENSIAIESGLPGEGRVEKDASGIYSYVELDGIQSEKLNKENPTLYTITGINILALPSSVFEAQVKYNEKQVVQQECYALYKDICNTELWPRPYYLAQDASKIATLSTDIFYNVTNFRAKVITGTWNVDKKWDEYVKELNSIGVNEFMEIQSRAYDAYLNMDTKIAE